jgi:hypothetical protein
VNLTPILPALFVFLCALACRAEQQNLPTAGEVMQRVLDRSAEVSKVISTNHWTYDKRTVVEELASNGSVESTMERSYLVKVIKGVPFSRLVSVGGKDLSPSEFEKEDRREAEFRKRVSGRDPEAVAEGHEPLIARDLAGRFTYQVLRRENLQNGPALLLTFKPRLPLPPQKTIQDRILNRLAGRFWVDEKTGEVASLDVRLTEGFSLGFLGMLGSIKSMELHLSRIPMVDGAWIPELTDVRFTARVMFSTKSQHIREESSNYRLQPLD